MQTHIDYQNALNPAQYEAATTLTGPVLVIAGAGSGKTRTIVYRLARLIESGVPASSILLLTFTRKAAQEMIARANSLMGHQGMPGLYEHASTALQGLAAIQGGTFHAHAYSILRLMQPSGLAKNLTVMDSHDILAALQHCREETKAGKGDKSFPKNQTIHNFLSKCRNKELLLDDVLRREAFHLLPHIDGMEEMAQAYSKFKREKGLLDYDDLLFEFDRLLQEDDRALAYCRNKHQYLMLDEYQDTNPVQARIAALVAGLNPDQLRSPQPEKPDFTGNIMVVGDDAQSIYAFRGADVRNILNFPQLFSGTKVIRLEENYRSTQPILDVTNAILEKSSEGFAKNLFTRCGEGVKPRIVRPLSDRGQAMLVAARLVELTRRYPAQDIAVLFRAGFHSYQLELELNKLGLPFRKYGGIRYAEAAHIKDAMSFIRLVQNPLDFTAFARMSELHKGVGAKTCLKIYQMVLAGDSEGLKKSLGRHVSLQSDLDFIDKHRRLHSPPAILCGAVLEYYQPRLEQLYPDDYPKRLQGLEQIVQLAASYSDLDLFISDMALEDPQEEKEENEHIVLSTIHSAKGLEWSAVIILDLVEERFPSKHSLVRPEDFEEERRLMYVACTRAKRELELYVPATLYDRGSGGSIPSVPSPFVRELAPALYEEWQESYTGGLVRKEYLATRPVPLRSTTPGMHAPRFTIPAKPSFPDEPEKSYEVGSGQAPSVKPEQCGYCRHKIFGRGKIIQHISPDKYRVNFPGFGPKVIMAAYLELE